MTINIRFSYTQEIEIGPIDNSDSHMAKVKQKVKSQTDAGSESGMTYITSVIPANEPESLKVIVY